MSFITANSSPKSCSPRGKKESVSLIAVTGKSKIYGVIGKPIAHSLTPVALNAAFESEGVNAINVPFLVDPADLKTVVDGFRAAGIQGFIVTAPHKETILEHLDGLDESARALGAANVIHADGPSLIGYNTDGDGYVRSIRQDSDFEPSGSVAVLIGAGGAARAVAHGLTRAGCEVHVINRTLSRAEAIIAQLRQAYPDARTGGAYALDDPAGADVLRRADLLVNCTSVGFREDPNSPIPLPEDLGASLVSDLIYNPPKTRFLSDAERLGKKTHNGLGMMVHGNALAFEIWTGRRANPDTIRSAVEDVLKVTV